MRIYLSYRRAFLFSVLSALILLTTSCVNTRKATYFNNLTDSTAFVNMPVPKSTIQPNDILSITVSSLNPEATQIFNTPNGQANGSQPSGYLVNEDSTILFPILGPVKAGGLTKEQLKSRLTQSLVSRKLLVDPIVNVRMMNFRVTVLGEVNKPAVIPVPSEKISLLEAIGLAGDLTIYAKRNNVLVIREVDGQKLTNRVDLNSSSLFQSPYYYLQANDVVYVEPNKARVAGASRSQQWMPIVFSGLSFFAIVADRLFRNN